MYINIYCSIDDDVSVYASGRWPTITAPDSVISIVIRQVSRRLIANERCQVIINDNARSAKNGQKRTDADSLTNGNGVCSGGFMCGGWVEGGDRERRARANLRQRSRASLMTRDFCVVRERSPVFQWRRT